MRISGNLLNESSTEARLQTWAAFLDPMLLSPLGMEEGCAALTHWLGGSPVLGRAPTVSELKSYLPKSLDSIASGVDMDGLGRAPFMPVRQPTFRFVDLFAGIGGFRLALQSCGGKSVFSSEWDRAAKATYFRNFGEVPFGDIRNFTGDIVDDEQLAKLIPDHEVLAAGFPCQPFSRAGVSARRSLGIKDGFLCETQGTLFFDLIRIAKVKRPKVLILENVKNLASHDGGRTFAIIEEQIRALNYSFSPRLLDAKVFLPQRRARYFMVCLADGRSYDFPSSVLHGNASGLESILEPVPAPELTISTRMWEGHQNRTARNLARGTGFTAFLADIQKPANTLVARYGKDGKECLIPQEGKNPRMLSPRECARLQGFPEEFLLPSSRTAAYRQFGNSVAVPLVRKLAESVLQFSDVI